MKISILIQSKLEIRRGNEYKSLSNSIGIQVDNSMDDIANRKEKLAYSEYEKLISLLKSQSILFLELGKSFKHIRDEKLFKYMGDGGFETWERFLSQPEIHVKPSTARFYIAIYEQYIDRLKLSEERVAEIGFSRLQKLLPVVREKTDEEAIEILDTVAPLGSNDFVDEVNKLKGYSPDENRPPQVIRDSTCGKWVLVARKEEICQCQKN